MNKDVFTQKEFLACFRVPGKDLDKWVRLKLIRPVGFTEGQIPLFSAATAERINHIRKLTELGYGPEETQKIIKKVGIPREKLEKQERKSREKFLTVGHLAEQSGVSPRTIKHWEDKGIIDPDMRSEGGFRLYSPVYVYLCQLIKDLQLFGYSLEDIKTFSGYFRDFLAFQDNMESFSKAQVSAKLDRMLKEIKALLIKTQLLKEGVARWESLMKKKRKEILGLQEKNRKRPDSRRGGAHA